MSTHSVPTSLWQITHTAVGTRCVCGYMYLLWAFIRTSQSSRHFIYSIYASLSDSPVYTEPVYFQPSLGVISKLQQRSPLCRRETRRSAVLCLLSHTLSMQWSFLLRIRWDLGGCLPFFGSQSNPSACLCIVVQQRLKTIFATIAAGQ